jgi:hypothetical protein
LPLKTTYDRQKAAVLEHIKAINEGRAVRGPIDVGPLDL